LKKQLLKIFFGKRMLDMFPDEKRLKWFEGHARKVIDCCKRTSTFVQEFSDDPLVIYVPGGDSKYPSFWIRDAVMQCRSGYVGLDVMMNMLKTILSYQNGTECRNIKNGLRIDPWAIPDHINLPGVVSIDSNDNEYAPEPGAVFYPGTYSPTDDQGDGEYGVRPADDNLYETVELARLLVEICDKGKAGEFLKNEVKGVSIIDRLHNGMQSLKIDNETGLPKNVPSEWAAASFHDALKSMGYIALTSVLRFRAAKTFADFYGILGNKSLKQEYQKMSNLIADSFSKYLLMDSGWVMVSSESDRQPCVWSTSMSVYHGMLNVDASRAASEAMLKAYRDGVISFSGYLRHTLTTSDAIPGQQVWQGGNYGGWGKKYGTYQAGGYWSQPIGWYAYALAQIDAEAAKQIACEYIDHTKKNEIEGAPFEWISPILLLSETPCLGRLYGPSVALPLEAFRRISKERVSS
jgi:hypothetical protein